jgi:hypothetical protein
MRTLLPLAAAGLLAASTGFGLAQSSKVDNTPGHRMQDDGPRRGLPGASGYTPGHRMQKQNDGARSRSPGVSRFAPGHSDDNVGSSPQDHQTGQRNRLSR